jgi:hypothetical protein
VLVISREAGIAEGVVAIPLQGMMGIVGIGLEADDGARAGWPVSVLVIPSRGATDGAARCSDAATMRQRRKSVARG